MAKSTPSRFDRGQAAFDSAKGSTWRRHISGVCEVYTGSVEDGGTGRPCGAVVSAIDERKGTSVHVYGECANGHPLERYGGSDTTIEDYAEVADPAAFARLGWVEV